MEKQTHLHKLPKMLRMLAKNYLKSRARMLA